MEWGKILFVIGGLVMAWFIYHTIKNQPGAFSKENLGKSFYTLGILALILIVFVGGLILMLRHM